MRSNICSGSCLWRQLDCAIVVDDTSVLNQRYLRLKTNLCVKLLDAIGDLFSLWLPILCCIYRLLGNRT